MADVNVSGDSSAPPAVDDKGVPYMNRVKELERKYQEAMEKLEKLQEESPEPEPVPQPDAELQELVKNPKAYTARVLQELQLKAETPKAVEWLQSQEGYDREEVLRTIREHNLEYIPSPMQQAKAAWEIVQKEKLAKKIKDFEANPHSTEPPGKSVPSGPKPKRADLIAKLKEASLLGNDDEKARIIGLLEDVRE